MKKTALITGITGQDGAYLAELLLSKNYKIYGTHHAENTKSFWRLDTLKINNHPNLHLIKHNLTDLKATTNLLEKITPTEVYNLASQSFIQLSFQQPYNTMETIGIGALNLLEGIRLTNANIRFYQASSSEMFGKATISPQNEDTPFFPRNPYSIAKLYAHFATVNYREIYGIFACSGILFNHESPLRGTEFVSRKITQAVAKIKFNTNEVLELGNLNAQRDWGYAKEYVAGMHAMLQANEPDTYILATNRAETVRKFVELAFAAGGIPIEWQGKEQQEVGINTDSGKPIIKILPKFYRPIENYTLVGNSEKAKQKLGWEAKTSLETLCQIMVDKDIECYTT